MCDLTTLHTVGELVVGRGGIRMYDAYGTVRCGTLYGVWSKRFTSSVDGRMNDDDDDDDSLGRSWLCVRIIYYLGEGGRRIGCILFLFFVVCFVRRKALRELLHTRSACSSLRST